MCETERFQRELALYQEVIHLDEETFYASSRRGEETAMVLCILFRSAPLARKEKLHHNPMFPHFFVISGINHCPMRFAKRR
ncbi:hypothetical protein HND97_18415 [Vibrio cholerae]|nr:hypothetical protein HND97_18415 [Vibrio cholerae]